LNSTRLLKNSVYAHMNKWINKAKEKKRTNTNTPQTFTWNRKGRNTAKLIIWSQYYTHPKTEQGQNKNRELLLNEHRYKNSQ
jgi:hypothetical protein